MRPVILCLQREHFGVCNPSEDATQTPRMSTADLMLRWAIALLLAATRVAGKTCSRSLPGSGAASLNSGSPECFSFWTRNREREPLVRIWGDVLPTWLEGADLEIGCQCCRESEWVWGSRVGALPSQRCSSELCVLCVRESKRRAPIIRFKDWGDPGPAVQLWGRYSEVQDLGGLHSCTQTPLQPRARKLSLTPPPTAPPSSYWVQAEQASLEPLPSPNGGRG